MIFVKTDNMKKVILLIFFTLNCSVINAQEIDIVGNWKVIKIISPKLVDNENLQNMLNGLSESTFHLKEDESISITSTNSTEGFRYFSMLANGATWSFKDHTITLVNKNIKELIMRVFVSMNDGKTIFTFNESNLILEVVKNK